MMKLNEAIKMFTQNDEIYDVFIVMCLVYSCISLLI